MRWKVGGYSDSNLSDQISGIPSALFMAFCVRRGIFLVVCCRSCAGEEDNNAFCRSFESCVLSCWAGVWPPICIFDGPAWGEDEACAVSFGAGMAFALPVPCVEDHEGGSLWRGFHAPVVCSVRSSSCVCCCVSKSLLLQCLLLLYGLSRGR